jgi:hypothetical protein
MKEHNAMPIWFFVGVILLVYGAIVLTASLHVPTGRTVASLSLKAGMVWGIVMMVFGGILALIFRPWTSTKHALSDKQSCADKQGAEASTEDS